MAKLSICRDFVSARLSGCPIAKLEATYLLWLDVSSFGIPSEDLVMRLKTDAKVWVNCGDMYGADGYIRVNIACPRLLLAEGLKRLTTYLARIRL